MEGYRIWSGLVLTVHTRSSFCPNFFLNHRFELRKKYLYASCFQNYNKKRNLRSAGSFFTIKLCSVNLSLFIFFPYDSGSFSAIIFQTNVRFILNPCLLIFVYYCHSAFGYGSLMFLNLLLIFFGVCERDYERQTEYPSAAFS